MSSIASKSRESRLNADYSDSIILSDRAYNTALGGSVIYGIVMNIIGCVMFRDAIDKMNPVLFLLIYFALSFGGIFLSASSDNPIISFIGYNMVVLPVGLVVSSVVEYYGGLDAQVVLHAFIYTAVVTLCMVCLSILIPRFFENIGGILFVSLVGIIIARFVALLLGFNDILITWISTVVFSLYIGYDFYRSQQFVKTFDNAIDCALDLYLDIINLFLSILEILGSKRD